MSPPGVVVVLVHQVLPGHQLQSTLLLLTLEDAIASDLEEEDASADSRSDDGPTTDEEVAGVVSNHVVQGKSESSAHPSYQPVAVIVTRTYRAPNPQETAMHSKNIKKSKLIPLAAYSSNSWKT